MALVVDVDAGGGGGGVGLVGNSSTVTATRTTTTIVTNFTYSVFVLDGARPPLITRSRQQLKIWPASIVH